MATVGYCSPGIWETPGNIIENAQNGDEFKERNVMRKMLIVDDHYIVRQGLKQILVSTFQQVIVDEAVNGEDALRRILKSDYDIILLEIVLPDIDGFELLTQLMKLNPRLRILILSTHCEEKYVLQAIKAGASGYLTKNGSPWELVMAIRTVLSDKKYFGVNVVESLFFNHPKTMPEKMPHELLTPRELEVLRMLASGKRLKKIADEMALSLSTVSTYRLRILRKLNLKNNADIIRYSISSGLAE